MEPTKEEFLFDTNIFNRLRGFDDLKRAEILKRLKERGVVVCTVPQILGELAGTFKTDPTKGQELCRIYVDFININGIFLQPPELLRIEIGTILEMVDPKELEEYLKTRAEDFRKALVELVSGQYGKETEAFVTNIAKLKKQHLKQYKDSKKLGLMQSANVKGMSFDEIWKIEVSSGRLKEGITGFLQNIDFLKTHIEESADYIVTHIEKTTWIKAAARISPAMSYMYLSKNEDPKYGDLVDNGHLIAVATLDGFVSDDPGALEFARLIHPEKVAISFNEFLQRIGYV